MLGKKRTMEILNAELAGQDWGDGSKELRNRDLESMEGGKSFFW